MNPPNLRPGHSSDYRVLGCQEERNQRRKPVKNPIAQISGPSLQWAWGLVNIKSHQATQRSCCRRWGMEDLRYFRNLYFSRGRGKVHAWTCRTEEACVPCIHSLHVLWSLTMSWSPCSSTEDTYSGRRRGWDDLRDQHWNMYIPICKIDVQCKFDAWSRAPKAGVLGQPRGIGWRRRWKEGSGWGDTCIRVANSFWCMA